ncbi:MAG: DNA-directed RNA polymerase subunit omega [Clostridiales bacterium]|nr:DNA-directed RNA polymerase subunit omega [Clostridiales bacterium]
MKYPLEKLLSITDNRYALVEIISQRSRQLRRIDESILISDAIDTSIDELLNDKLHFYKYNE